jgi:hypothetical protein
MKHWAYIGPIPGPYKASVDTACVVSCTVKLVQPQYVDDAELCGQ